MERILNSINTIKSLMEKDDEYTVYITTVGYSQFIVFKNKLNEIVEETIDVSDINHNELCELLYDAIITNINSQPNVNFVLQSKSDTNYTSHKNIFIEISKNVALFINDKNDYYQRWIDKMYSFVQKENSARKLKKIFIHNKQAM